MKKITNLLLLLSLSITGLVLANCSTSCNCSREIRCTTIVAQSKNAPEEKAIYCSSIDYTIDQVYSDSIDAFRGRNFTAYIVQKDSTLSFEEKKNLRRKDADAKESAGFSSVCFK